MPRKLKAARPKDVKAALEEMPDNYLECYTGQHTWVLYKQIDLGRRGWERRHFCPRCKMNRFQVITRRGGKLTAKYQRPDGYGLKGIGAVQANGRAVAVLETVRRTAEKDLPEMVFTEA
jgi:hypothetical protein